MFVVLQIRKEMLCQYSEYIKIKYKINLYYKSKSKTISFSCHFYCTSFKIVSILTMDLILKNLHRKVLDIAISKMFSVTVSL